MAKDISMIRMLGRSIRRPGLVVGMLKAAWRFRARGWWRHPPFLPVPPREYLDWRWHTAYGDGGQTPTVDELDAYVRWANRLHRTRQVGTGSP